MFLNDLNEFIADKAVAVIDTSISNVFLKYCIAQGHKVGNGHMRLAAGLEYLDYGVLSHYEGNWTIKKVLLGDQYYAIGLKNIAESGLDFVSSATLTLMKITQAYANKLNNYNDYINSFALWQNVPNFVSYLEGKQAKILDSEIFALNAAYSKSEVHKLEIESALNNLKDQNLDRPDIAEVFKR